MAITAGTASLVSVTDTTAILTATAVTGAVGPVEYQWHKSTTSGFSPSGGNAISGAESLDLTDTGLIPNTTYFYKLVATDTGDSNTTATYTQVAVVTAAPTLSQNQFAMSAYVGMLDQQFDFNTFPVQIDVSQPSVLYAGAAVKMVDSAGGVPKVIGCTADSDDVLGFINYDLKTISFAPYAMAEISRDENVMYLYATAAIARGAKVQLDLTTNGGVAPITGSSGADIVGWAFDKATAPGQLIRVVIKTPYIFGKA